MSKKAIWLLSLVLAFGLVSTSSGDVLPLGDFEGDLDAKLVIHRDDDVDEPMPVSHFFRDPSAFTEVENEAIDFCSGHVLEAGAGTGLHSLVLQQKGLPVTAVDISSQAVAFMSLLGVANPFPGYGYTTTAGSGCSRPAGLTRWPGHSARERKAPPNPANIPLIITHTYLI